MAQSQTWYDVSKGLAVVLDPATAISSPFLLLVRDRTADSRDERQTIGMKMDAVHHEREEV
jgi:hypothetical protein